MHFGQVEATIYYEHIKNTQRSQLFWNQKVFLLSCEKRSCTDLMLLNMNMLVIRFCGKAWKSRLLCTLMGCHKTQYIDSASYSARMPIHSEPLGLRPTTFFFIGGQGTTYWMLYGIAWLCQVKFSKVTCMHGVRWHNISILGACLYAHITFGVDLRFSYIIEDNTLHQYRINLAFH